MTSSRLSGRMWPTCVGPYVLGVLLLAAPMSLHAQDVPSVRSAPVRTDSLRPGTVQSAGAIAFSLRYSSVRLGNTSSDRWLGRDKAKHVVGTALWTLSSQYILVNKAGWTEREGLPVSVASGAAIGVTKELYDASRPDGVFSGRDLTADVVGIGVAVGIILL